MNAEELEVTAIAKKTRILKRVMIEDFEETNYVFMDLMGKNADPRKVFILENSSLGVVDI